MDWQVTAKTIFCSNVMDEVTIFVKSDWTVTCTGMVKYLQNRRNGLKLVERSLELKRVVECKGSGCSQISEYTDQLKKEEALKSASAGEKK
jgi:hypothetical protein